MSGNTPSAAGAVKSENKVFNNAGTYRKGIKNNVVKKNETPGSAGAKFMGEIEALKGHIYDITYNQAELYVKTTRRIGNHIGSSVKNGELVQAALEYMELPTFEIPEAPPEGASRTDEKVWEKRMDVVIKRESLFADNMRAAYFTVWSQCSYSMRAKVEAKANYKTMSSKRDVLELLRHVKDITHNFQSEKNPDQATT